MLLVLFAGLAGCRSSVPIQDISAARLSSDCGGLADPIDEAAWRAGRKIGWAVERDQPGVLRAVWRAKGREIVASIVVEGDRFSIRFDESNGFPRSAGRVHPTVNRLLSELASAFQREPIECNDERSTRATVE